MKLLKKRILEKKGKLNNKGAAMISVLVVTTFITIIATTMLYMATTNYRQKQTDYQNKQSFYGAEKALDELKCILVADVQEAYIKAYNETAKNFLVETDRSSYYQEAFMKALNEKWKDRVDDSALDTSQVPNIAETLTDSQEKIVAAIQKLMKDKSSLPSTKYADSTEYEKSADCFYKVDSYGVYNDSGKRKFALRGIQVKCTSGNYTTFLYTDICIEPPEVNWSDHYTSVADADGVEDRKRIPFTDYVYYTNWHRADYDERNDEAIEIGTFESMVEEESETE